MTGRLGVLGRMAAGGFLAAGAIVVMAAPASAATSINVTSPTANALITNTTTPPLTGTVTSDGYVCGLDLVVDPGSGQPVSQAKQSFDLTPSGGRTASHSQQFNWAPTLAANGQYTLTVTAHTMSDPFCQLGQVDPTTATRTFALAVAAAAPTGVTASPTADRHVDLTWKPNTEPDLSGYAVFRVVKSDSQTCPAPADADRIATVQPSKTPAFTDTFGSADPGGVYCYSVEAERPGAGPNTVVTSAPSKAAEATVPSTPTNGAGAASTGSGATASGAPGSSGGSSGSVAGAPTSSGGAAGAPPSGAGLDMSRFVTLENQAKVAAGKAPRTGLPPLPDGTFDPKLPFKPKAAAEDGTEAALPGETVTHVHGGDNIDRVRTMAAIAASLVVFVVVGHLMLLRREVKRVPVLDAVEP